MAMGSVDSGANRGSEDRADPATTTSKDPGEAARGFTPGGRVDTLRVLQSGWGWASVDHRHGLDLRA